MFLISKPNQPANKAPIQKLTKIYNISIIDIVLQIIISHLNLKFSGAALGFLQIFFNGPWYAKGWRLDTTVIHITIYLLWICVRNVMILEMMRQGSRLIEVERGKSCRIKSDRDDQVGLNGIEMNWVRSSSSFILKMSLSSTLS